MSRVQAIEYQNKRHILKSLMGTECRIGLWVEPSDIFSIDINSITCEECKKAIKELDNK